MTADLKTQLATLEAEFAALEHQRLASKQEWDTLQEQVRPLREKMTACEDAMDAVRSSPRWKELSEQLPHLRKAVRG